jgi:HSP20 family protein
MVMRFDPFRDIDRLTQQLTGAMRYQATPIPMDAYRRGGTVFVHFDLPGADPSSIDIQVEQNALTVRAERFFEEREGDEVLVRERHEGASSRQLFLGQHLDLERIQASYDHGVLTLSIPVAETASRVGSRSDRAARGPNPGPSTCRESKTRQGPPASSALRRTTNSAPSLPVEMRLGGARR